MKNNFDVDKIVDYLKKHKEDLPSLYTWNANINKLVELNIFSMEQVKDLNRKTPYEKELVLKRTINEKLVSYKKINSDSFNSLALWIIKGWGGIKAAKDSSTLELVEDFFSQEKPKFKRIASSSKVGAYMCPEKNIIYDSRVAYSLNWIILSEQAGSKFFPIPEGRNSKMLAFDMNVLIRMKNILTYRIKNKNDLLHRQYINKKDKDIYIAKDEAYFELSKLIKKINQKLWRCEKAKMLYYTEMLLFSIADKEIFDDITKRISININ